MGYIENSLYFLKSLPGETLLYGDFTITTFTSKSCSDCLTTQNVVYIETISTTISDHFTVLLHFTKENSFDRKRSKP